MPEAESSETVLLLAPLGKLSSIIHLFPSLTFTSRKRSSRGDDNLEYAEYFLRITEEQLTTIYNASQQASEAFAREVIQIEDDLDK
jgi:hypothetical protein